MSKDRDVETFDFGIFRMERNGRFIAISANRSKEDHHRLISKLAEYHKTIPSSIKTKAEKFEHLLQKFNSFDIIAHIAFKNTMINPETYKEYSHRGSSAFVEYLTLLCLKRPFSSGKVCFINSLDVEKTQASIEDIFRDALWYYISEHAFNHKEDYLPPSPIENLRFKTIIKELYVRNPGYPHHLEDTLKTLFSPLNEILKSKIGFNMDEAVSLVKGIASLVENRLRGRRKEAKDSETQLLKEVIQYKKGKWNSNEYPEEVIKTLSMLSEQDAKKKIRICFGSWFFFRFGSIYSFSPEELAEATTLPIEIIKSFLNIFSLPFGSIDADFYIPAPIHPLKTQPIIYHDERYMCPSFSLLLWAIKPRLEEIIKNDSLWKSYEKARKNYLENESLKLLGNVLKEAKIYKNLKYKLEEDSQTINFELDGLIIFDNTLMLIECKAGGLSSPARRGGPDRIVRDLKKLVAEAHAQAIRARNYIFETSEPTFELPDGKILTIDKSKFKSTFLLTTTLEPLGAFTPVLYKTKELGIFEDNDLPWAVCLFDLRVICELIDFPSQLIHYLKRRLRINELGIAEAHDELDWFGQYLKEGLYFEELPKSGFDNYRLLSYTTEIDDYYFYINGVRKTYAPKPSQKMSNIFKQLINELEDSGKSNYLDVTSLLLEMSGKDRTEFEKLVKQQRERTKSDGRIHDFTLFYKQSIQTGVTFVCAKGLDNSGLEKILLDYSLRKKEQTNMEHWIAIGNIVNKCGLVHALVNI